MKKAQYFRFVSCVISVILCCLVGFAFVDHKAAADEKNILEDGTYTMQSFLRSASSDQASMGNAGIVQPIQLIVKNGTYTVRAECKALSTKLGKINFTGYLAQMSYFPNWKTTSGKIEAPENETPIPINIESYFENTYDSYNDPKTGTDSRVKGKIVSTLHEFSGKLSTGRNVGSGLCTCYGSDQQRERSSICKISI